MQISRDIPIERSGSLLLLKQLWNHFSRPRKLQFKLLIILSIIVAFLELVSLGSLLPFLSVLISPESSVNKTFVNLFGQFAFSSEKNSSLIFFTALFCVFIVISTTARLILLRLSTKICFAVGSDLSKDVYRINLLQSYSEHLLQSSSEIISAASTKVNDVINGEIIPAANFIISLVLMGAIFSALFYVDHLVTVVLVLTFGFLYLLIMVLTKGLLRNLSYRVAHESSNVIGLLQEALGGIRDVIIGNFQNYYVRIYGEADQSLRLSQGKIAFLSQYPRYVIEGLGMLLMSILAFMLVVNGEGNPNASSVIPVLGVFTLGAQRLLPIMQVAYHSWAQVNGNKEALREIVGLLNRPNSENYCGVNQSEIQFNEKIEFKKVQFSYGEKTKPILDDISFEIPKGACIGIVGKTGAGKSTLVDLLMALLIPTSGGLFVDGRKITDSNSRAWQSILAHVPQSIYLADGTIEQNIAFGLDDASIDQDRLQYAARVAQLTDEIKMWPNYFKTMVGERGVRLSGGQRQRIGIARALYKEAEILVFDEATSSLDHETESLIIQAIHAHGYDRNSKITILMIAHRLSTLKNCTHILEVCNGRVNMKVL